MKKIIGCFLCFLLIFSNSTFLLAKEEINLEQENKTETQEKIGEKVLFWFIGTATAWILLPATNLVHQVMDEVSGAVKDQMMAWTAAATAADQAAQNLMWTYPDAFDLTTDSYVWPIMY